MQREIVVVDMWILIVVSLIFPSGIGGSEGVSSVTFREFRQRSACEEAVKLIKSASPHIKAWCLYDNPE